MNGEIIKPRFYSFSPAAIPRLGQEGQFARQRGIRSGRLTVEKHRIVVNDGTVDAVILDSVGFHIFDASGNETLRMSSSGLAMYGEGQTVLQFQRSPTGDYYGTIGLAGGNAFYMANTNAYDFHIYATSTRDLAMLATKQASVFAYDDIVLDSDSDASGAGEIYMHGRSTGSGVDTGFYVYDFGLSSYVEKSVILPTSRGFRAMYCIESPEFWFVDFCFGILKRNWPKFWKREWLVKPDKLFLEVTEKPYIIMPTGENGLVQVWGKRKGKGDKRFEEKTRKEFQANEKFWPRSKNENKDHQRA